MKITLKQGNGEVGNEYPHTDYLSKYLPSNESELEIILILGHETSFYSLSCPSGNCKREKSEAKQ